LVFPSGSNLRSSGPSEANPPLDSALRSPPLPVSSEPSSSWASKFKSSFLSLRKVGSPVVADDGIPQMKAPDSVWALDIGFWHSGHCSFSLSPWSPSATLGSMKLDFAPVWVLFRNVPPELWSSAGFSTIASGVGFPAHSEFPHICPYSNGIIKLKVVVELAKPPPPFVRVSDKLLNSVLISVEYLQLPPKCASCGNLVTSPCGAPLKESLFPTR
ncbi:hypothetical protein EUTSA_v10029225mg, partial [Eutrema salsugineum]